MKISEIKQSLIYDKMASLWLALKIPRNDE